MATAGIQPITCSDSLRSILLWQVPPGLEKCDCVFHVRQRKFESEMLPEHWLAGHFAYPTIMVNYTPCATEL